MGKMRQRHAKSEHQLPQLFSLDPLTNLPLMPQATYQVEVHLDPEYLLVKARDLEHAVRLAKEEIFRRGFLISVERTYDEGEEVLEDDEDEHLDFHWDIGRERFNPEDDRN
jgi:hypothetical protein